MVPILYIYLKVGNGSSIEAYFNEYKMNVLTLNEYQLSD